MEAIVGNRDINTICGVSWEEVQMSGKTVGIINTDGKDGMGKHWVSFVYMPHNVVFYYDSLGDPPTSGIASKIAPMGEPIIWWEGQQQPDASDKCGFYSLNFVRNFVESMDTIDNPFDAYLIGMNMKGTAGNEKKVLERLKN